MVDGVAGALSTAQKVYSAIAGAGQGSAAAVAFAGVTGLMVAAVGVAAYEIHEHKEEEFLADAKEVQKLKEQCLPGGPDIFTFSGTGKLESAKTIALNQALRDDQAKDESQDKDSFLIKYKKPITDSLKIDLGYFDFRVEESKKHETDVTASVLTWLMEVKNKHLLNFEGYDQDMKILDGLIKFMNGFVSIARKGILQSHDPKKRDRFKYLQKAIKKLKVARKLLSDHANSRNMKDFVDDMMSSSSKVFIPQLSNLFLQAITPPNEWKLIKSALDDNLAKGELRPEEKSSGFLGVFSSTKKAVKIPDSIFKTWLKRSKVSANNLETADEYSFAYDENNVDQIKEIKALFNVCDNIFTRKSAQRQEDGKVASDRFVPVGHDESCYVLYAGPPPAPSACEVDGFYVFKDQAGWKLYETNNRNLQAVEINLDETPGLKAVLCPPKKKPLETLSKSDKKAVNKALTEYRNHKQLISRTNGLVDLGVVQEQMVDLEIFSTKLSDAIAGLGEIYVENPHHCNFILETYEAFGEDIKKRINVLLQAMDVLDEEQEAGEDLMIGPQYEMAESLRSKLADFRERITVSVDGAMAKHNAHTARFGKPLAKGVIDPAEYDKPKYQKNSERYKAIKPLIETAVKMVHKYNLRFHEGKYELRSSLLRTQDREVKSSVSSGGIPGQPLPNPVLVTTLPPNSPVVPQESKEEEGVDSRPSTPDPGLPHFHDHLSPPPHPTTQPPLPPARKLSLVPSPSPDPSLVAPPRPLPLPTPVNLGTDGQSAVPDVDNEIKGDDKPKKKSANKKKEKEDKDSLDSLLSAIEARIKEIYKEDNPDGDTRRAYEKIHESLAQFEVRSKNMILEKDHDRQHKGQAIKDMNVELCKSTLDFLNLDLDERRKAVAGFHDDEVQKRISDPENKIDVHKGGFGHFCRAVKQLILCLCLGYGIYDAVKQGGFAITASRRVANQLQEGSKELENKLRARR